MSSSASAQHEWAWMGGSKNFNATGSYGTLGTGSPGNTPGARNFAATWVDTSGNPMMYGGLGFSTSAVTNDDGTLDDMWKLDNGQWMWAGGHRQVDQSPVFGTLGVAASTNSPGAVFAPATWTDAQGNFWLFSGDIGHNALWKLSAGMWTWVAGPSSPLSPAVYGTMGVASAQNVPGARLRTVTWVDTSGNLWMYGGYGYGESMPGSQTSYGALGDLWMYSPSQGMWTWMGGTGKASAPPVYGTRGTASKTNYPGARSDAAAWTDAQGNFWLFGGNGTDSTGTVGNLNDLWEYSGGQWTWMSGSNLANQSSSFTAIGEASASNTPGGRVDAAYTKDAAGNFWLFGGLGYYNIHCDLWKFSQGQWTLMSGPSDAQPCGTYGQTGVSSASNLPSGRSGAALWADSSGNLWLFGGIDSYLQGQNVYNDLWEFKP